MVAKAMTEKFESQEPTAKYKAYPMFLIRNFEW